MTRQVNMRLDTETYERIKTEAKLKDVSVSELLTTAFWTLGDVLYEGDEYGNKISNLKKAVEYSFKR